MCAYHEQNNLPYLTIAEFQNYVLYALAHTQNSVKQRHGCRCSNFERVMQDALTRGDKKLCYAKRQ